MNDFNKNQKTGLALLFIAFLLILAGAGVMGVFVY
jgi:hypothetical protein